MILDASGKLVGLHDQYDRINRATSKSKGHESEAFRKPNAVADSRA
jgi:hypothetical protein